MPTTFCTPTIKEAVPLRDYSSWKVGGPARWLVECQSLEALRSALEFAKRQRCPFLPIGKGSNLLFSDRGFDGLIIVPRLERWAHEGDWWTAQAGVSFAQLGHKTAMAGYSGLEFAAGIPAAVGGALFMNAGAQGQETKDCLREVALVWPDGSEQVLEVSANDFSYRTSPFQQAPCILTQARFELRSDPSARARQLASVKKRIATQPYELPSAGCVFRNPDGQSAGALIDQSGCKGWKEGDAEVSAKHANFLVNLKSASAEDLLKLMERVVERVHEIHGVTLHPEVRMIEPNGGWNPWS
jgi:UDP-N-acetylmuramate dehydrogenase